MVPYMFVCRLQHTNGPGKLNIVRLMRDILLGAHQQTEHSLFKDAKSMRRTLQVQYWQ
jgi:hypothetical protein